MGRKKSGSGIEQLIIAAAVIVFIAWVAPSKASYTNVWIVAGILLAALAAIAVVIGLRRKSKAVVGTTIRIEPTSNGMITGQPERDLYPMWKESSVQPARPASVDTSKWSLELLSALEWKRFEEVTTGFFQCLGFKTKTTRRGADGGVDIYLFADGAEKPSVIVQCKAWRTYKVSVKPIRELLGVMTQQGIKEGAFVTTGTYTKEARDFVVPPDTEIDLIDGDGFLAKIASLSPQQQSWLLEIATAGDFTTPTCAGCGVKMVLRENKKKGDTFWGCVNYPRCRLTLH